MISTHETMFAKHSGSTHQVQTNDQHVGFIQLKNDENYYYFLILKIIIFFNFENF